MSADLTWLLVRRGNSFLVQRDGARFSAERGNLTNKHSFKFSGIANNKAVDVRTNKAGKIELSLKKTDASRRKPAKSLSKYVLNRNMVKKSNRSAEIIRKLTHKNHYRADLTRFAIARYHALARAKNVKGGVQKKARKPRGSKKTA